MLRRPRWPPWSRHPPRCARPSPDPPRRSRPEPSRRPPRGLHGAGARGSSTARNGPAPAHGSPVAGTPAATGNPSNATPDRALNRCPRSSPPGACGNSARAAPRARPSWPRNRAGSSPRQRRRSRPRSAPTAGGRKTHDPASAASPPSPPSSPPDDPSAVPSPSANPPVKSNIKESDQAACVQCRLRQRAVKPSTEIAAPNCDTAIWHIARHRASSQGLRECGQSDSIKPGKALSRSLSIRLKILRLTIGLADRRQCLFLREHSRAPNRHRYTRSSRSRRTTFVSKRRIGSGKQNHHQEMRPSRLAR